MTVAGRIRPWSAATAAAASAENGAAKTDTRRSTTWSSGVSRS